MILNVKEFQNLCKVISNAVDTADENAANLELAAENNCLRLNVTNTEYYVSAKFNLPDVEKLHATVPAKKFLDLIAGLTTTEITLTTENNNVKLRAGKSSYKIPMIFENEEVTTLNPIVIQNTNVEMNISIDVLRSINKVNSAELTKAKTNNFQQNELQKYYYITEEGCFTYTNGACLNKFTLEKPVKMLLNERIVKLFKLFNEDVKFALGHDADLSGGYKTKISFETDNIYLAAYITNDDILLNKIQGPYTATKNFIRENYPSKLVLSTLNLKNAVSRLMTFSKTDKAAGTNNLFMAKINFTETELVIKDKLENTEVINIEAGSITDINYSLSLNLIDVKAVLDSCSDDFITLNCGNHRSVVITRGNISNLIPEGIDR